MIEREKYWRVLYTKSNHERVVANAIAELGFEVYLPTRKEMHKWSDRKKLVEIPLFKSYVFVRFKSEFKNAILISQLEGVINFVRIDSKLALVPDYEIIIIKKFLAKADPGSIQIQSLVEIVSGPFKGNTGFVEQVSNKKVKINIRSLNLALIADKLSVKVI